MAKDPYRYFRIEARELLDQLTRGVLELEKAGAGADVIARLLRLAHTLKGAARVVKQPAIAELAHTIEDLLTGHGDPTSPMPAAIGTELLGHLDRIGSLVRAIDSGNGNGNGAEPSRAPADEAIESLRVDIHEMDALLRGVTEAEVQLAAIRGELGSADRLRDLADLVLDHLAPRPGDGSIRSAARARSLTEELRQELDRLARAVTIHVERVEARLDETRSVAHRLRLVPAHSVFPVLDRAARDTAQALGKSVDFEVAGGDVRLDANVLASLRDALMHIVRNAIAHGIESPADRIAAGKPAAGRVRLRVERRGDRVSFACTDDGRGVDVEAVRNAAIRHGTLSAIEARALAPDAVVALLGARGLTTSEQLTELSGRGIGLDVAREAMSQLKGEMTIRSEPGRGATVELEVRVSIASLIGLVVEAGGTVVTIPLDAVKTTLRVTEAEISRSAGHESIVHEGRVIRFLPLERALRRPAASRRQRRAWSTVVVQAGNRNVAVGVDRLIGTASVVMRALPAAIDADPIVSGASLDAEGTPQLVLEPGALASVVDRDVGTVAEPAPLARAPVLVVDDSLTTRMLEQSILESAGYAVELAVSAEEGLARARECQHSVFIVDVEMPGMDGFGFVAETRADPALRGTPAILVTSRNAPDDRRRGEQAGARGYIVKGEFDQNLLLDTIRRLIG